MSTFILTSCLLVIIPLSTLRKVKTALRLNEERDGSQDKVTRVPLYIKGSVNAVLALITVFQLVSGRSFRAYK